MGEFAGLGRRRVEDTDGAGVSRRGRRKRKKGAASARDSSEAGFYFCCNSVLRFCSRYVKQSPLGGSPWTASESLPSTADHTDNMQKIVTISSSCQKNINDT